MKSGRYATFSAEGLERQGGSSWVVRIWRYTAWQNGAIVSCPATAGLRLVSDNTDLSGAEIHRVTAKYKPGKSGRLGSSVIGLRLFVRGVRSSPRGFG